MLMRTKRPYVIVKKEDSRLVYVSNTGDGTFQTTGDPIDALKFDSAEEAEKCFEKVRSISKGWSVKKLR
jgi:hypothetical protein